MGLSDRGRNGSNLHLFPLLVLVAIGAAGTARASQCYHVNQTTSYNNDGGYWQYPLDTDGLSGRYTGYWSNTTDIELGDITFQLWFLTYDDHSFTLSLVAMREPTRKWDLYRPVVLWTANRDRYFGEGATLDFGADGELIVRENGLTVWSTGTAGKGVTAMCITNLGNLLLTNSTDHIIWQSFDSPSDTISTQVAFKPGNRLVSWASPKDSSQGSYSLAMEENRLALYFNSEVYWSFESDGGDPGSSDLFAAVCWQTNGLMSLDLQRNASMPEYQGFLSAESCQSSAPVKRFELLRNTQNFTYGTFLKLNTMGDLTVYTWNTTGDYWYAAFNLSSNFSCFLPQAQECGPYGICNKGDGQCCPGSLNYQGGVCGARRPLPLDPRRCEPHEIVRMEGVDYFSTNFSTELPVVDESECRRRCEVNCSCMAAFFKEKSCFQTHEPIQSMITGEYTGLLKVAKTSVENYGNQTLVYRVALPVLLPALVLLVALLAWICWKKSLEKAGGESDKEEEELEMSLRDCMPRRFTYKELEQITGGFSKCLGQGGYGSVYRGSLEDGNQVAVKKLQGSNQTSRDFYAEVASLARTNHLNLVKFMGFCAEGPRKRLLVYEFVPNGSLEKWIFGDDGGDDSSPQQQDGSGGLSWDFKFRIAVGTAQGLCYLHEECAEKIIHLDLKPENVLVDIGFVPKIADFGLSKLMNREVTYLQMTSMRGTPGYLAPEYLQVGTITEKSDVYSFGVLLLEIITGCRNKYMSSDYLRSFSLGGFSRQKSFTKSISKTRKNLYNCDGGPSGGVADKYQEAGMERLKAVAYLCVQDDPDLRPSMSTALKMMEGLIELPETPPLSSLHFFLGYRSKVKLPSSSTSKSMFSLSSVDETSTL
ncbi:G-type lectin S-receptor-like serine/threonine-protein kinase SD2-5 [Selaginella moellendorffii]|nr:G-type lectin S-receptor-like serine/threonine-protein kinase SD2-5 [Selaginella moellendorffii]|eukprot:XP_024526791.1 G-type lectin S-receptor-like serine/threonine-protein kinase SD2-5 [Selaginella moellendorffii]